MTKVRRRRLYRVGLREDAIEFAPDADLSDIDDLIQRIALRFGHRVAGWRYESGGQLVARFNGAIPAERADEFEEVVADFCAGKL